ncbi:hypothetical protein D3C78_19400 [compost metagenome]
MKKLEFKASLIDLLMLQRRSTQKDPVAFADEIVQNAHRAGAKNVWVSYDYYSKVVTFENDGPVLEDMQKLFTMGESGWGKDVMETENPFGMGFFANTSVSNKITIISGPKKVIFDVDLVTTTRDASQIDTIILPEEEHLNGFKLILENFEWDKATSTALSTRITQLGNYVHELDIFLNGKQISKKNLTDTDGSSFSTIINDPILGVGWLSLTKEFSESVNVFYKGRKVTTLPGLYYLNGDLHITDKALNLTAPDRKDIIRDNKYSQFTSMIRSLAEELAFTAITTGTITELDKYSGSVVYWADKKRVSKVAKFRIFLGDDEKAIDELNKLVLRKANKDDQDDNNDELEMQAFLNPNKQSPEQKEFQASITVATTDSDSGYSGGGGFYSTSTSSPITAHDTIEDSGEAVINGTDPVFWVKESDLVLHRNKIRLVQFHKLSLIVARNRIEIELLEHKSVYESNVFPIEQLEERVSMDITLSNTSLSNKEKRAEMIFDMISRMAGFEENIFQIGDLMVVTTTSIDCVDITNSRIEEDIVAIASPNEDKIFIDRTAIRAHLLEETLDENLNLNDYKFILANMPDIQPILLTLVKSSTLTHTTNLIQTIHRGLAYN